ncbi:MAG: hypothetical protein RIT81_45565 [Deltaproteobacteria bacterium]
MRSYRSLARIAPALVLALAACSSDDPTDADNDGIADGVLDPNNVTVVAPTRPQGYVAGEVWDAATDRPLGEATVRLIGGGIAADPATTPNSGAFEFGPIAAGAAFSIAIEKDGFTTATFSGLTIDDAAGNFPTINGAVYIGPVALVPTTGSFDVLVVSRDGAPVPGALVTAESGLSHLVAGNATGTAHASATTDMDGRASIAGLPDVGALPPRFANASALTLHIAPVDLDMDGVPDLDGTTVVVSGSNVREQALPELIVLDPPGDGNLRIIASNVSGLAGGGTTPAILPDGEPARVVFSAPIDRESLLVDLRNEMGMVSLTTAFVVSALGNVVTITSADRLLRGQEYNLALRVQSVDANPRQIVTAAAPFFVEEARQEPIEVGAVYNDGNSDGQWGSGPDDFVLTVSAPVGSAGANPAFRLELWVALDLNGTSTVGDAPGELPARGELPAPLVVQANEPVPGNGGSRSGYTRFLAPVRINLPVPLGQNAGSVDYEVRFTPERNGGQFITTPGGRMAPARDTGTAALTSG